MRSSLRPSDTMPAVEPGEGGEPTRAGSRRPPDEGGDRTTRFERVLVDKDVTTRTSPELLRRLASAGKRGAPPPDVDAGIDPAWFDRPRPDPAGEEPVARRHTTRPPVGRPLPEQIADRALVDRAPVDRRQVVRREESVAERPRPSESELALKALWTMTRGEVAPAPARPTAPPVRPGRATPPAIPTQKPRTAPMGTVAPPLPPDRGVLLHGLESAAVDVLAGPPPREGVVSSAPYGVDPAILAQVAGADPARTLTAIPPPPPGTLPGRMVSPAPGAPPLMTAEVAEWLRPEGETGGSADEPAAWLAGDPSDDEPATRLLSGGSSPWSAAADSGDGSAGGWPSADEQAASGWSALSTPAAEELAAMAGPADEPVVLPMAQLPVAPLSPTMPAMAAMPAAPTATDSGWGAAPEPAASADGAGWGAPQPAASWGAEPAAQPAQAWAPDAPAEAEVLPPPPTPASWGNSTPPQAEPPPVTGGPSKDGRVIALFGCRGGAGTTTLATNIAGQLALAGKDVCLVDLDVQLGDALVALDLEVGEGASLASLAREHGALDPAVLKRRLPRHSSGVYVVSQGGRLEELDATLPEHLPRFVASLRACFDVIVVDGIRDFSELALPVLDNADCVGLVVSQEVAAVRRARRALEVFGKLGLGEHKLRVVLTRHQRRAQIGTKEIERALAMSTRATVANDYKTALKALNAGALLGEIARRKPISKDVARVCGELYAAATPAQVAAKGAV